ncbi:MAG TPA: exonuclease domain-containing protein [bacterium]|nr:exonuclease domain-containing protein [bacterium]
MPRNTRTAFDPDRMLAATLAEVPLVVVDVETTGLDPARGDRVCEVALIRREPSGSLYEWSQLVDPQRPISPGAYAVNRISTSLLRGAPRFSAVIPEINDVADGAVWLAHNAPFDMGFLRSEYRRARRVLIERPVIDTVHLARRHFRFRSNRLAELAREFGIPTPDAHRALGDCRTTLGVFEGILTAAYAGKSPAVGELVLHADRLEARGNPWTMLPPSLEHMLSESRDLDIVYVTAQGVRSSRRVTVVNVVQKSRDLYLVAHCHMRGDERTFRLDRIVDWKIPAA